MGVGIGRGVGELSWPSREADPALPRASRMLCGQPGNNAPRRAGGPTPLPLVGGSDGPRSVLNVEILTQSWVSHLLAFNTSLVFNKKKQHYFGAVNLFFTIWHTLMPLMFLLLVQPDRKKPSWD